ncbi:unnamed protein product, partial [Ixodes persulcatus]
SEHILLCADATLAWVPRETQTRRRASRHFVAGPVCLCAYPGAQQTVRGGAVSDLFWAAIDRGSLTGDVTGKKRGGRRGGASTGALSGLGCSGASPGVCIPRSESVENPLLCSAGAGFPASHGDLVHSRPLRLSVLGACVASGGGHGSRRHTCHG